ncbi:uncharacterized protein LOC135157813 [Lytechinus pictus]|uniref:uncharacterized protein LOC135157813 n=1 Tax=Lytechinus pictus TaxID=7653 RepID=UPI0030B9FCA6
MHAEVKLVFTNERRGQQHTAGFVGALYGVVTCDCNPSKVVKLQTDAEVRAPVFRIVTLKIPDMVLGLGKFSDDIDSEESDSGSAVVTVTKIICENKNDTLDCGEDLIDIGSAVYGRTEAEICPHSSAKDASAMECNDTDVTTLVRGRCDNETFCEVESSNGQYGDPCHGIFKYLNITYSCKGNLTDQLILPVSPQNDTWVKKYNFGFISLTNVFTKHLRIVPNSNENTYISVSCVVPGCMDVRGIQDIDIPTGCDVITVCSTADITVHGIVRSEKLITGGFLALPNDFLGEEYLIDVYTPKSNIRRAQVAITAIHNDTNVVIECVEPCTIDNQTFFENRTVVLSINELLLFKAGSYGGNLTGTLIRADKSVSVVVGSMGVVIPSWSSKPSLDHGVIIEQLMPVSKWGRVHFVPPFQNATNGWVIRVSAFYHNTNLTLSQCGNGSVQHRVLNRQQFTHVEVAEDMTSLVCLIISDKPVQVMQYMASSTKEEYGDPSMTLVPPVQDYHGNTTFRCNNTGDILQYVDIITSERGKDSLQINGGSVTDLTGHCFNVSEDLKATLGSNFPRVKEYCYFYKQLKNGTYHVTQSDQSERFLVRLYAQSYRVGGAMLAGVSFQNPETMIISTDQPTTIGTTMTTTINATMMSEEQKRASLSARLSSGDFKSFGEAEQAMSDFTDYLGDREELGSIDELVFAFDYFTSVLKRNPLKYATGDNAKSFLNISSDAINVLFADRTNQLLLDSCAKQINLTSTPEDAERELEGLMNDAASLIVNNGSQSFGVSTNNAALEVTSTGQARSSAIATESSVCEGALDLVLDGVHIPCEVLRELGSSASYRINLPHGAEAVARSSCEKYDETKIAVASPLLGVGLISERKVPSFSKNITLTFPITKGEEELMDNNTLCSYWDYNTSNWSSSGCTFDGITDTDGGKMVTCLCDHLTSFAVLLNVSSTQVPPGHEFAMGVISWVGCSLSIVACFFTCFGYAILKLHSDLILIHGNLALAVGGTEIAFLCLNLVQFPSIPCTVVGSLIYYLLLTMFAWMAIEGIHLYLLTFVVWNAERRKIKHYMACGWGVPVVFLIVLLSVQTGELGNQNACFLSLDDLSLLFLMVPIAIIILFNLFVMVRVVRQIAKMADGPTLQSDVKSRVRHGVKAIFVLLPIMGLTWVFAFLAIERASVAFQYIFVISNSFQGVFIFFVHFIRNSEVRHAVKRRRDRWLVSQSRQGDYKVKNTKKTSSSGVDKTSSSLSKSPEQTLTLMNMNTELVYGGDIPDKNGN